MMSETGKKSNPAGVAVGPVPTRKTPPVLPAAEPYDETAKLDDSRTIRFDAAGVPHAGKKGSAPSNPTKGSILDSLLSVTPDPLGLIRKRASVESKIIGQAPALEKITLSGQRDAIKDLSALYEQKAMFAEGGHARIASAKDVALGRHVAVKWLKDEFAAEPKVVESFLAEARLSSQLDHPGLPPVHALGRDAKGRYFLSMKLIRGRTLREYLDHFCNNYKAKGVGGFNERGALTTRLEHFLKICDAMSYAHNRGVIHRDLKPENVMIGEFREVYVMDWGIAKLYDAKATQPVEKLSVDGTPRYLAPELIDGRPASFMSDVFSLGAILFEIMTLKIAVPGSTVKEIIVNTKAGVFEPIVHRFPEVSIPGDLKAIVAKALAHEPADRYQKVEALAEDIRRFLRNEEVSARRDNLPRKILRAAYNHPTTTIALVLLVVLLSSGFSIHSLYQQKAATQESKQRELMLISLQSKVADRAFKVDRVFLHLEDMLTWAAVRATRLLEWKEKVAATFSDIPLYSSKDIGSPETAPPDTVYSQLYRFPVSLDHPVYKLPGKLGGEPPLEVRALASIGQDLSRMLLMSDPEETFDNTRIDDLRHRALDTGLPLRWCYIGLPDGAVLVYPGSDSYPAEYDASKRPWFISAQNRRGGVKWGSPYIDVNGQGLVLACAIPLHTADGSLLGVAALDMTFDDIIATVMAGEEANKAVLEKYLLDEEGRIVVSSKLAGRKFEVGTLENKVLELPFFPQPEVLRTIIANRDGQIECEDRHGAVIYVFSPIHSLGWTYVEKVNLDILLGKKH